MDRLARSLIRMDARLTIARWLAASLSYRVATRPYCLIVLKNRSIKFRTRCRWGQSRSGPCNFVSAARSRAAVGGLSAEYFGNEIARRLFYNTDELLDDCRLVAPT